MEDNYVRPLHKHVVCIEKPTLAFIGLTSMICLFPAFDLQVSRFILIILKKFSSHK